MRGGLSRVGSDVESGCEPCGAGEYSTAEKLRKICEDRVYGTVNWHDQDGDTCDAYEVNGWCGQPWVPSLAVRGVDASEGCCACGGGNIDHLLTCSQCPDLATSLPGSVSLTECRCLAGHAAVFTDGSESFRCAPCPRGSFNPTEGAAGLSSCSACQAPRVTLADGAISSASCVCPPGTSDDGHNCLPCEPGSYSDFANGTCKSCDATRTTYLAGARDATQCLCGRGYRLIESSCEPCPIGLDCVHVDEADAVGHPRRCMSG